MMHAPLEELDGFLAAHPETEWFTLIVSDINGVARGKVVRRHEMEAVYRYGRPLPSSILSLDIKGEDVPETGLVWDIGDMDCRAFPVAGSLKPCPWLEGTAQVLISFGTDCGLPMEPPDPRLKLQQVTDRFKANGMVPVVAIELEFYLLDKSAFAERGELVPARLQNGMPNEQTQVYGVAELEAMRPFFDDIYHFADMQDLPAETAISEYAPGQFEITLRHRANALQAADEAIAFKRLIKAVADRHGMLASFMAKPFSGLAGCGMHIHASIEDDGGRNLFAADAPEGSPLLGQAIAGMRDTAADCMAIFAPNANSYRRYQSRSYAPVALNWGINNRTVTFRIPAGPAHTRHVEHRLCGADANPYLATAAMLGGMLHGMENRLDPGPQAPANAYAGQNGDGVVADWGKALDSFAGSAFAGDCFGETFRRIYSTFKRMEMQTFMAEVSDIDRQLYLRTV
ncbi:MAG: glutamine synthetase [Nitratireductor sp.]|nr:glutamine synthetase [Nitratireductor sp.]